MTRGELNPRRGTPPATLLTAHQSLVVKQEARTHGIRFEFTLAGMRAQVQFHRRRIIYSVKQRTAPISPGNHQKW
jgi:hypothetical protein